jgi:hypothetical protein
MLRYVASFWALASVVKHATLQLVESSFACLRRCTRGLAPAAGSTASEHLTGASAVSESGFNDQCLVLCAVFLQRLHLLFEGLFIGLFLQLGIFLQFAVDLAPISGVARFMRLLLPVRNVPLDEAKPYLARLSE